MHKSSRALIYKIIHELKGTVKYEKFKEYVIQQFKENDYRRLPYVASEDPRYPGLKILSDKRHIRDTSRFLYKYVSEEVIRHILGSDGSIRFCEPTKWNDKYESIFYRTHDCLDKELSSKKVFISCFTTKPENEAAWKAYLLSDTDGQKDQKDKKDIKSRLAFRLKINKDKMRRELIKQFGAQSLYEAPVAYLHKKQISGAIDREKPRIKGFPPQVFNAGGLKEETDYVSLLSMKRDYFSYEEEIRYFIVSTPDDSTRDMEYMYLKNPMRFVEQITVVRPYGVISVDNNCENLSFKLSEDELRKLAEELRVAPTFLNSYNPYEYLKNKQERSDSRFELPQNLRSL